MTDDIVTALRMRCDDNSCVMLCQTAADEIERLRAEVGYWHAMADRCDQGCSCLEGNQ